MLCSARKANPAHFGRAAHSGAASSHVTRRADATTRGLGVLTSSGGAECTQCGSDWSRSSARTTLTLCPTSAARGGNSAWNDDREATTAACGRIHRVVTPATAAVDQIGARIQYGHETKDSIRRSIARLRAHPPRTRRATVTAMICSFTSAIEGTTFPDFSVLAALAWCRTGVRRPHQRAVSEVRISAHASTHGASTIAMRGARVGVARARLCATQVTSSKDDPTTTGTR